MTSATTAPATPLVGAERLGNIAYGILGHLGAPLAYALVLAFGDLDVRHVIWGFIAVAAVFGPFVIAAERLQPDTELPPPTLFEWVDGLFMIFVKGAGIGGCFVALGWLAFSALSPWASLSNRPWRIAGAVLLTDLGYYFAHRFLSHSRRPGPVATYYGQKHDAHHSVTAMDFLRGNQSSLVDTAFSQFQPSLILVASLLGLDLAGTLAAYALILLLQLTDHTNVTFNIGWLRFVFMDNHAHRLHHCGRGELVNFAAAFSIWDRWFGTYHEDRSVASGALHRHHLPIPAADPVSSSR